MFWLIVIVIVFVLLRFRIIPIQKWIKVFQIKWKGVSTRLKIWLISKVDHL